MLVTYWFVNGAGFKRCYIILVKIILVFLFGIILFDFISTLKKYYTYTYMMIQKIYCEPIYQYAGIYAMVPWGF